MMRFSRQWSVVLANLMDRRASSLACSTSGSSQSLWDLSGPRRHTQSQSGANSDNREPTKGPQGPTRDVQPVDPASPLQAPASSPEVQALADKLRQSSPTGRLLDLFAPQGREVGARQQPGGPLPSAATAQADALPAAADADVVAVVMRAVENCKPLMSVMQNKTGNRVTYVPKAVQPGKSTRYAVKWIVQAAEKRRQASRGATSIADCLAVELLLAYQRKGAARAKRDELHKLALDNRANLRGRWW